MEISSHGINPHRLSLETIRGLEPHRIGGNRTRRKYEHNIQSNRGLETGKVLGNKKAASGSKSQSGTHSSRGVWGLPLGFRHGGRLVPDRLAARARP